MCRVGNWSRFIVSLNSSKGWNYTKRGEVCRKRRLHNEENCGCNRVGAEHDSDARVGAEGLVGEAEGFVGKQVARRDGDLLRQHRRAPSRYDYKGSERYNRRLRSD